MTEEIEIKVLASGQPRPYADHEFKAEVVWFRRMLLNGAGFYYELNKDLAASLFRHVQTWDVELLPENWHRPQLISLEPLGPTPEMVAKAHPKWPPQKGTRWAIHVRTAYCD